MIDVAISIVLAILEILTVGFIFVFLTTLLIVTTYLCVACGMDLYNDYLKQEISEWINSRRQRKEEQFMILKDLKPKFNNLELYIDKKDFGILEVPQRVSFDFALYMYSERKVLYVKNHDFTEVTEVLIESE